MEAPRKLRINISVDLPEHKAADQVKQVESFVEAATCPLFRSVRLLSTVKKQGRSLRISGTQTLSP